MRSKRERAKKKTRRGEKKNAKTDMLKKSQGQV